MPPKSSRVKRTLSVGDLSAADTPSQPSASQAVTASVQVRVKKRKHDVDNQLIDRSNINSCDDNSSTIDAIAELHVIIGDQRAAIDQLRTTVNNQQDQINALLSILGVTSTPATVPHSEGLSSSATLPSSSLSDEASSAVTTAPVVRSYANTVRDIPALSAPLKQAVVTAVYRDLKEHERRARNIIINGVPPVDVHTDDSQRVSLLLESEFGVKPDIVKFRRIGKKQPTKAQPLLITLRTDDQATYFVDNAKRLRQSSDAHVRHHVFVNRDVTKAEAQAAYMARCERRQRAAEWAMRRPGSDLGSSTQLQPSSVPSSAVLTAMNALPLTGAVSTVLSQSASVSASAVTNTN